MEMDKEEIERAIAHQRKMLRVLRQRLEQRELQEAQQGINVQPEVISDIHDLTERIQRHEAELARLQTQAAVDKEPLAEVEYRALLAERWDTPGGRPTVAGAARLEYHRLRLGVAVDRAQEIEHEIRVALAGQAVANLDAHYLPGLRDKIIERLSASEYNEVRRNKVATVQVIERAIRLDLQTAIQSFTERIYSAIELYPLIEAGELRSMLRAARAWATSNEQWQFERFADVVEAILVAHQTPHKPSTDLQDPKLKDSLVDI